MNGIPPVVRYMIVCDDVVTGSEAPTKPVIVGLTTAIHANQYPFRLTNLCVFLVLTGGRGQGNAKLRLIEDGVERILVEFSHPVTFPADPLAISGIPWRLVDLEFAKPGVYRIEFHYNDQCLAHQLLDAR
jgi:uncharacterized protein DUF6941